MKPYGRQGKKVVMNNTQTHTQSVAQSVSWLFRSPLKIVGGGGKRLWNIKEQWFLKVKLPFLGGLFVLHKHGSNFPVLRSDLFIIVLFFPISSPFAASYATTVWKRPIRRERRTNTQPKVSDAVQANVLLSFRLWRTLPAAHSGPSMRGVFSSHWLVLLQDFLRQSWGTTWRREWTTTSNGRATPSPERSPSGWSTSRTRWSRSSRAWSPGERSAGFFLLKLGLHEFLTNKQAKCFFVCFFSKFCISVHESTFFVLVGLLTFQKCTFHLDFILKLYLFFPLSLLH